MSMRLTPIPPKPVSKSAPLCGLRKSGKNSVTELCARRTLNVLPGHVRRALFAVRVGDRRYTRATLRAKLTRARDVLARYEAAQRIHSESVDAALATKGADCVDASDAVQADDFRERIERHIPAMEKRRQREAAIDLYKACLRELAAEIEGHPDAQAH